MLAALAAQGFSDEQVFFTYRTFNGFLLGYPLLETGAMALRDSKPGDGSFVSSDTASGEDGGGEVPLSILCRRRCVDGSDER